MNIIYGHSRINCTQSCVRNEALDQTGDLSKHEMGIAHEPPGTSHGAERNSRAAPTGSCMAKHLNNTYPRCSPGLLENPYRNGWWNPSYGFPPNMAILPPGERVGRWWDLIPQAPALHGYWNAALPLQHGPQAARRRPLNW